MINKNKSKNKICVVVGGTRGIGLEVAKGLAEEGLTLIITGRTSVTAKKAMAHFNKSGRVSSLTLDVTSDNSTKNAVSRIIKKFGRIDVLVISAGIFKPFGTFDSVPLEDNLRNIHVNLIGTIRCVYYVVKHMKKQDFGRIILFSGGGIGGDIPLTNAASYFTSKGAITVFTEVLASELVQFNITINAVLPGQILTDLTRELFNISDKQLGPVLTKAKESLIKTGGTPIELTLELTKFLISNRADNVTGRLLSARWDSLKDLYKKLPEDKYKLRRIEGKVYKKA